MIDAHVVGLDTAPLIYYFEEGRYAARLGRHVFERLGDAGDPLHAVSSTVALAEILVKAYAG